MPVCHLEVKGAVPKAKSSITITIRSITLAKRKPSNSAKAKLIESATTSITPKLRKIRISSIKASFSRELGKIVPKRQRTENQVATDLTIANTEPAAKKVWELLRFHIKP